MCVIAGYTGKKRAAPLLVEMMKKTEYIDGGLSTGIATIHEGKLYTRKVLGDVATLLRETDALSLPGTTGIIHSRTSNNFLSHAHPQISDDGKLAAVALSDKKRTGAKITLVMPYAIGDSRLYAVSVDSLEDIFARGI